MKMPYGPEPFEPEITVDAGRVPEIICRGCYSNHWRLLPRVRDGIRNWFFKPEMTVSATNPKLIIWLNWQNVLEMESQLRSGGWPLRQILEDLTVEMVSVSPE